MSTLSALLVLGQGAFLSGSWWAGRAVGGGRVRPEWVVVASLVLAIVGVTPEVMASVAGSAGMTSLAQAVGLLSVGSMALSQAGLGAFAGGRAVQAVRQRRELSARASILLARGDAAFAGGYCDEARSAYQEQVAAAQAAGEDEALGRGLARIAWLDYVTGRFAEARASIGWAAGGAELEPSLGCSVILLAGCLGLSDGRLDVARAAIEDATRLAEEAEDDSQLALARVALGCEHYLEGWDESGRQFIETHAVGRLRLFDRHVAGTLLLALALVARHRGREEDARAFGARAVDLVAGNAALEPLARYAAAPESAPWLERPAGVIARLVAPA